MRRRGRALWLVACALLAAQAADASFLDAILLRGAPIDASAPAQPKAAVAPAAGAGAGVAAAAAKPAAAGPVAAAAKPPPPPPPAKQKQREAGSTAAAAKPAPKTTTPPAAPPSNTTPVPQQQYYYAPPPPCSADKPCPDLAMTCCGGKCLDTSRGGVACVADAPCPSAGVCASPAARPGDKAPAVTCCLFPGVCVGGKTCCQRSRVCGSKCCPEGYACLAGACAPAGCLGVKQGVALAPPPPPPPAAAAAAAAAANNSSSTSSENNESCTALVPEPPLPKGLAVEFADEQLASSSGGDAARRAARPFVRVESADACCALCAATEGCTSFTHGGVVLAGSEGEQERQEGGSAGGDGGLPSGDAAPRSVRTSCELWAEGGGALAGHAAGAAAGGDKKPAPPANGESGERPGPASSSSAGQRLQPVAAPAWVTSGRVPRPAEGGSIKPAAAAAANAAAAAAANATGAGAGDDPCSNYSCARKKPSSVGGGLYNGLFDTHVGDYQGSALKQDHESAETPCARASDAVKQGGAGAEALFRALHPGTADAPSLAEAVMSEDEYMAAAAALLGPDAATKEALDARMWTDARGGGGGAGRSLLQQQPAAAPAAAPSSSSGARADACGASLALMTSTWLAGGTLLPASGGASGATVGTVRACCELCAATGGCEYWTFSTPLSSCWLRSGSGGGALVAHSGAVSGGAADAGAVVQGAVASQPSGGGPLSSVPCRYSISGAMQGAPSPGLCPAALVCRGQPTAALPDGAASCCPAVGWACSAAGVCCPPGSNPCGSQCGCPQGTVCAAGVCQPPTAAVQQAPQQGQTQFASAQQPQQNQQQQYVQAQQPPWQSQLLQFQGQQPGQPGGNPASGGAGLVFGPGGGQAVTSTFSADTPRFGYYGRAVVDGAALVTDASDPQACRQRPAEGAAALRYGRVIASNSGGALNRNAPVAQATAVDCCLACAGIGNCDAFSWDGTSLGCFFWTNKINGVKQQRLETAQRGAVVGDMIRSLSFRADGTPVPRLDDSCRAPCGPSDGSRPALCCVDGRELCLAPTGVGVGGDRHQCCPNASVCGRRCGCDGGELCVSGETCCPGERVCGSLCCPQGQVCNQNGACGAPQRDQGLIIANPQPYGWGWNRGGWWGGGWNNGGWNNGGWNGGWNNGINVIPIRG